ncbi:MAG: RNA polymerase factor sigma-54 [Bradymonadales bacterium]
MPFKMQQQLVMKQQLRMTQQLQQAIKLLQLTRLELVDKIQEELTENPALEEISTSESIHNRIEDGEPPQDPTETPDLTSSLRDLDDSIAKSENIDWEAYLNQYQTHTPQPESSYKGLRGEDLPSYEATLSAPLTLVEHLQRQVRFSSFDNLQRRLADEIIGNLNEDGYLIGVSLEEIAAELGADMDTALYVIETIQEMDPIGVAARSLEECLMIQAEILCPNNIIVRNIIEQCIPMLERKNYDAIAKHLKISQQAVIHAAKIITSFNPKPGVSYGAERPHYITPDVFVEKINDNYHVVINDDGLPKLRVASYFADLVKDSASPEASNYVREKMTSARWFLRSIQQRERTIYRVTQAIIERQREFFDKGVKYLKPMVLKDIADDTELSESTISRVTNKKYLHCPQGTYELKFFFTSGLSRSDAYSDDIASESVKAKIRQIVANEDPKKPYSDQKIADLLAKENIEIARRTVAKYREMLGILSSSQRKSMF